MQYQVGGTGVGGVDAHEGKRMIKGIASALAGCKSNRSNEPRFVASTGCVVSK